MSTSRHGKNIMDEEAVSSNVQKPQEIKISKSDINTSKMASQTLVSDSHSREKTQSTSMQKEEIPINSATEQSYKLKPPLPINSKRMREAPKEKGKGISQNQNRAHPAPADYFRKASLRSSNALESQGKLATPTTTSSTENPFAFKSMNRPLAVPNQQPHTFSKERPTSLLPSQSQQDGLMSSRINHSQAPRNAARLEGYHHYHRERGAPHINPYEQGVYQSQHQEGATYLHTNMATSNSQKPPFTPASVPLQLYAQQGIRYIPKLVLEPVPDYIYYLAPKMNDLSNHHPGSLPYSIPQTQHLPVSSDFDFSHTRSRVEPPRNFAYSQGGAPHTESRDSGRPLTGKGPLKAPTASAQGQTSKTVSHLEKPAANTRPYVSSENPVRTYKILQRGKEIDSVQSDSSSQVSRFPVNSLKPSSQATPSNVPKPASEIEMPQKRLQWSPKADFDTKARTEGSKEIVKQISPSEKINNNGESYKEKSQQTNNRFKQSESILSASPTKTTKQKVNAAEGIGEISSHSPDQISDLENALVGLKNKNTNIGSIKSFEVQPLTSPQNSGVASKNAINNKLRTFLKKTQVNIISEKDKINLRASLTQETQPKAIADGTTGQMSKKSSGQQSALINSFPDFTEKNINKESIKMTEAQPLSQSQNFKLELKDVVDNELKTHTKKTEDDIVFEENKINLRTSPGEEPKPKAGTDGATGEISTHSSDKNPDLEKYPRDLKDSKINKDSTNISVAQPLSPPQNSEMVSKNVVHDNLKKHTKQAEDDIGSEENESELGSSTAKETKPTVGVDGASGEISTHHSDKKTDLEKFSRDLKDPKINKDSTNIFVAQSSSQPQNSEIVLKDAVDSELRKHTKEVEDDASKITREKNKNISERSSPFESIKPHSPIQNNKPLEENPVESVHIPKEDSTQKASLSITQEGSSSTQKPSDTIFSKNSFEYLSSSGTGLRSRKNSKILESSMKESLNPKLTPQGVSSSEAPNSLEILEQDPKGNAPKGKSLVIDGRKGKNILEDTRNYDGGFKMNKITQPRVSRKNLPHVKAQLEQKLTIENEAKNKGLPQKYSRNILHTESLKSILLIPLKSTGALEFLASIKSQAEESWLNIKNLIPIGNGSEESESSEGKFLLRKKSPEFPSTQSVDEEELSQKNRGIEKKASSRETKPFQHEQDKKKAIGSQNSNINEAVETSEGMRGEMAYLKKYLAVHPTASPTALKNIKLFGEALRADSKELNLPMNYDDAQKCFQHFKKFLSGKIKNSDKLLDWLEKEIGKAEGPRRRKALERQIKQVEILKGWEELRQKPYAQRNIMSHPGIKNMDEIFRISQPWPTFVDTTPEKFRQARLLSVESGIQDILKAALGDLELARRLHIMQWMAARTNPLNWMKEDEIKRASQQGLDISKMLLVGDCLQFGRSQVFAVRSSQEEFTTTVFHLLPNLWRESKKTSWLLSAERDWITKNSERKALYLSRMANLRRKLSLLRVPDEVLYSEISEDVTWEKFLKPWWNLGDIVSWAEHGLDRLVMANIGIEAELTKDRTQRLDMEKLKRAIGKLCKKVDEDINIDIMKWFESEYQVPEVDVPISNFLTSIREELLDCKVVSLAAWKLKSFSYVNPLKSVINLDSLLVEEWVSSQKIDF
ncbi:hypothetical protein O181_027863 [Austropuccinia psidii MF-1]|uniref:Uncharacterized protein n=1 Tax=Austropuccinia psidii MF-1 TaxID=1389203 RepID=A0A9Q3CQD9_9BASI|nr:hypothetical protein [Austropuccinia psidii MF-1]